MSITGDTGMLLLTYLAAGGHFSLIFFFQRNITHHGNALPSSEASAVRVRCMLQARVFHEAVEYMDSLFSRTHCHRVTLIVGQWRLVSWGQS